MLKINSTINTTIKLLLFSFIISACSNYKAVDYLPFQESVVPTAIVNVNVLSEDGENMLPNRTIFLVDGKISSITKDEVVPKGIKVIDGSGKYVIPGLVESHAHLKDSPNDLLVFIAHGVTYIREMSGNSKHITWKDEIAQGRLGPKIYIASRKVESRSGISGKIESMVRNRLNISTEAQANDLIDGLVKDGYKSVKISSYINKPMYLAITSAARDKGLAVAGHIPPSISLDEFLVTSHKEVAHVEEFTKLLANKFGGYNSDNTEAYLQFVRENSDDIAHKLKKKGIAVGTTLWYTESITRQVLKLESLINTLDLSYGDPSIVADWMPGKNHFEAMADPNNPEYNENLGVYWNAHTEAVRILLNALVKHEVTILAGTDTNISLVIPGISIHHELESLVKNGMSAAQALRTATQVPGKWMNSNTGKIAVGFEADLVLLNDNPLHDITNTQKIDTVILAGKVLDKAKITSILNSVREAYNTTQ